MKANRFAPIVIEEIKRHIKNDKYINNPHLLGLDKFMEIISVPLKSGSSY